jgi:acetylornithine deacetylase/succinyl-diaminopimelate desuccinylase-like protein
MIGDMARREILGAFLAVGLVVGIPVRGAGTAGSPGAQTPSSVGERLMSDAAVKTAIEAIRRNEPDVVEEQIRLCEIPAPPFGEKRRADAYKASFEALGLENVRIDEAGNVLGERPGLAARPHLVFGAHLDTVFPEGTIVRTTRSGSTIKGPGIADDCRGLAVLLGVVRAINEVGIRTPGTITFVGTVGEEGLGDLRGVKHLFDEELKGRIDRFVSVDGAGIGITRTAVGSHRYR